MSLILIKPDAFERRLAGTLIREFEKHGDVRRSLTITGREHLFRRLYQEHRGLWYYDRNICHLMSGQVLALDVSCSNARSLMLELRSVHGTENPRNLMHCSDPGRESWEKKLIWR